MRTSPICPALALSILLAVAALAQKNGDAAKGKEVFEQCGICHSATTGEKKIGPSLKGIYKKAALKDGKKVTDASVTEKVNKGGNGMPAFAEILSAGDKADLLAYLKTL